MNDGKIIIDKIIADAEEAAKKTIARGRRRLMKYLRPLQEKAHKETALEANAQAEARKGVAEKEISSAQMQAKSCSFRKAEVLAEDD